MKEGFGDSELIDSTTVKVLYDLHILYRQPFCDVIFFVNRAFSRGNHNNG